MRSLSAIPFSVALVALTAACQFNLSPFGGTEPLEEKVVLGDSGPKIALLEIDGVISETRGSSPLGTQRPSMLARARETLDLAKEDDDVVALVIRVQSPGGTVSASAALHHEISEWKAETGRPVVAFFQGISTSGGYYISMPADEIVALPTTITGSIGVVLMGLNVSGLMEKVGVENQTFTSGAFKDTGSPFRPMREDEKAELQGVVDDLASRFREVVRSGRPNLDAERVAALADGKVWTARQAKELGLIDEVGFLEEAVERLEKRLEIEESRLVAYVRPGEYRSSYFIRPGIPPVEINVDILSLDLRRYAPGLYYIWPPALVSWPE